MLRREAAEAAVERVVTLGRELLERDPSQLLEHLERQARRLLAQQAELSTCRQQLAELQSEVEALKQEVTSRVAPFRRKKPKGQNPPKKPGRQPGHRGEWLQSPPSAASDEHIEVSLEVCPDCGNALESKVLTLGPSWLHSQPPVLSEAIRSLNKLLKRWCSKILFQRELPTNGIRYGERGTICSLGVRRNSNH